VHDLGGLRTNSYAMFTSVQAGYTKKLGDLKWAIAGRDTVKLEKIKDGSSTCSGVIVADSSNQTSIDKMVARTKVLLSFAGPFTLYGTPVVESCVRQGTHYCDSTGEVPWIQSLMKQFHGDAVKNNALIVPMCGFDCLPSDLGVLYAVQKLRERGVTSISSATLYAVLNGAMSGGTLSTGILMESKYKEILDNPFSLGGGPENDDHLKHALNNLKSAEFSKETGLWLGPFVMENLNTRVVRRSAADLNYRAPGKGGFRYAEVSIAGSEARAKKLAIGSPPPEKRKQMMDQGKLPKPGEGPAFPERRRMFFQSLMHAKADDGTEIWTSLTGGDGGYEDTALMCCEAALTMALEYAALPRKGGVLTPSVAMGTTLIERLDRAGLRFRAIGTTPHGAIRSSL